MSTEPILRVRNLTKYFPIGRQLTRRGREALRVAAVDDVSFDIPRGTTLGLVGESGCGKSTLARCIVRLLEPSAGSIEFMGHDITGISQRALRDVRRDLVMVFQDPMSAIDPRTRIAEVVAEPLEIHRVGNRESRRTRVHELLERVGLSSTHATRFSREISGGERQRVALARALALEPKLIIFDEPVSALDVSIQAQIVNLLQDLQRELGLTYLFIAHDLEIVRRISDDVHVMYLGTIMERGPSNVLYSGPRHPYSAALLSAHPEADPRRARARVRLILDGDPQGRVDRSGCRLRNRCPRASAVCAETPPFSRAEVSSHEWACHHPFERWPLTSVDEIRAHEP